MALTFEEFKKEVLNRARDKQVCSAFQWIILAKDYLAVLKIAKKFSVWLWSTNIVDLELLKHVPEADLLKSNIYCNPKNYLKNPTGDVYILTGESTIECAGVNKFNLICLGGTIDLKLNENSFAKVKGYFNSEIKVSVADNSVSDIHLNNQSKLIFRSEKETNSNIVANQNTKCEIESFGESFVNLHGLDVSEISYKSFDNSQIKIKTASTVNIIEIKENEPEL